MPRQFGDRIRETSSSTGTGNFALSGAALGYRAFSAVCSIGDTMFYVIEGINPDGTLTGEWEVGVGTYSAANTLTRSTVISSSNANAAVNFSEGAKNVWLDFPAGIAGGSLAFPGLCVGIDVASNISSWQASAGNGVVQVGGRGSIAALSGGADLHITQNAYWTGTQWTRIATAAAWTFGMFNDGSLGDGFFWRYSASAAGGGAVTWSFILSLRSTGDLYVGADTTSFRSITLRSTSTAGNVNGALRFDSTNASGGDGTTTRVMGVGVGGILVDSGDNFSYYFGASSTRVFCTGALHVGSSAQPTASSLQLASTWVIRFPDEWGDKIWLATGTNKIALDEANTSWDFNSTNAIGINKFRFVKNGVVWAQIDATGMQAFTMIVSAAAPTVGAAGIGIGNGTATTVGAAGGASALPATPVGYWIINVGGTNRKVPYYNT